MRLRTGGLARRNPLSSHSGRHYTLRYYSLRLFAALHVQMTATSSSNSRVEYFLSRFPQPVTLYPSTMKWVRLATGSALLTAVGGFLDKSHSTWAWFAFSFFALCTVLFTVQLLPGAGSFKLNVDGFESRALFLRRNRSLWRNVTNIKAVSALSPAPARTKIVWYNDTQWNGWWLARRETAMLGYNTGLADTYGLSAEELVDLMTRWQERALARRAD